jgi:hypothetical protein
LLAIAVWLSGCVLPSSYSKSIAVKKDADGKVLEIVETETVFQSNQQGYPIRFEYVKDIQPKAVSPSEVHRNR